MSKLDFLDTGSLGIFYRWRDGEVEEHEERGWIARSGTWVHIDALDEREPTEMFIGNRRAHETFPSALVGRLPTTTVVALELLPRGQTMVFGQNASTRRYSARTLVADVPLDRLRSSLLKSLSSDYLALGHWSGMREGDETWTNDADGLIESFELKLGRAVPDQVAKLSRHRRLVFTSKWSVLGPADDRRISTPLSIRVESTRPVEVFELLAPLIQSQNLINAVCSGFVPVSGASAGLDLLPDGREPRPRNLPCWSGPLFECPDGVSSASNMSFPLLSLPDLGGADGVARWIRLWEQHPRAVGPAISPYRVGTGTGETELLMLAAAFEYWVAVHRHKRTAWADKSTKPRGTGDHQFIMECVAGRAGRPFADLVGDVSRWCADFSKSYNRLKHDPAAAEFDPTFLNDLVRSARLLLFGVLADRAAGTKAPTRKLFKHHAHEALRSRLQDRYK